MHVQQSRLRVAWLVVLAAVVSTIGCNDDNGLSQIEAGLANDPRIESVEIGGFWEMDTPVLDEFTIISASARLKGRPGRYLEWWPYAEMFDDTPELLVYCVGRRLLCVQHEQSVYDFDTPDFGYKGAFAAMLPFKIKKLGDLFDHYDELEAVVAEWPIEPAKGIWVTPSGAKVEYWVEISGSSDEE